jgi:carboxyl-terminal processing protease
MNRKAFATPFKALILFFGLSFFSACHEDDNKPAVTNEANNHVNSWILENMNTYYLWNDQMNTSGDKNQDPSTFFKSLLYSSDRFSWIQDNYQDLLNSLKGITKEAGFEFVLYRESQGSDNVIAQVVYVKPGSPAETAGLVRGDVISHINDKQFTVTNYKDLLGEMSANYTIRYKSINVADETFSDEKTTSLSTVEYSENPNFLHKVIEINDHKIGYYIYNFFADGPDAASQVYTNEMDQVFADFKAAGITDLILDLRYNSGGAETSANNLASLIGVGVDSSKVFASKHYNTTIEAELKKEANSESYFTAKFRTKVQNIGSLLQNNRVYILTSHRSASASELVINALKPYMDVFLIGDVTYGKNVGSFSLYDETDPKNKWGMQPIVVKVFNSLGQSDYSSGFTPNVTQLDNGLFIYPLGDTKEVLLGNAIGQITGTATTGRAASVGEELQVIGHSLDAKRRSYQLTVEQKNLLK